LSTTGFRFPTIARDPLPIVDAHHHLWAMGGVLRYPGKSPSRGMTFMGDFSPLRKDYLPEHYFRDAALHNVVATVHVEAECDRAQQVAETEWVSRIAVEAGMPNAIVAHAWVDEENSEEILAAHRKFPLVRGIRTKPVIAEEPDHDKPRGARSLHDPKWRKGLALLEKYDLSWDLRVPWWHLREAAAVTREHPGMRIVLNHTGYPLHRTPEALAEWRRGMEELADCPNVWCKISGLVQRTEPWTYEGNLPIIRDTIRIFGVERCMFASNFPVDGLKASWDHIYQAFKRATAEMSAAERTALFSANAASFYRIDLP
jgi:predicted TIM-barrel fold metal-dependent hydrolase